MLAILSALGRLIGIGGVLFIGLLLYEEGVPGASRIAFPESWPVVGGFGLVDIPIAGDLTAGRVHTYAAQQVKLATADMVTKFERDTLAAQLAKEKEDRLRAEQMTTEASERADAAIHAKTKAQQDLEARIKADTAPDGGRWTEEDEKWNAKR
ncbi:hypothetical protein PH552_12435 [Rhizobium sp. CNPSo 3968]|uniref:hypothetical protein n=1 Tax=Rhizobium sp. CNPSo 3968 TaxID=3021408 RepID=UPI00254F5D09|nr:hypothetical protein [Rhizobium sp. CNPSo 3968]MDK4720152.1 hypothetical protein [Rhizobium sp. CNPSo 3968]